MERTIETISVFATSAFGGYALHGIEYGADDYAIISYNYDGKRDPLRSYRIKTTATGRLYVTIGGIRVHLDNFIKV